MKFLKSKLFVGIACFVLAALIAFVGVPVVNSYTNAKVPVVRFTNELAEGAEITEEDLEVFMVTPSDLPSQSFADVTDVIGKYTVTKVFAEDFATQLKIAGVLPDPSDYFYALPKGQLAVSFSLKSFAAGVSGKLLQGDIIALYSVVGSGTNAAIAEDVVADIDPGLSYLKVLAVTDEEGLDTDHSTKDTEGNRVLPDTVTVSANSRQAALITGLEQSGFIHAALVSRGNEEYAMELLKLQEYYFTELARVESGEDEGGEAEAYESAQESQQEQPAASTPQVAAQPESKPVPPQPKPAETQSSAPAASKAAESVPEEQGGNSNAE